MKLCVAFGVTPFAAVMVMGYTPPVVAAGVPLRTPPELRVTPLGRLPVVTLNVGTGKPVAVTVKVPGVPVVKVVLAPLVIVGGKSTESVKLCVALGVMPFCAVIVIG